MVIKKEFDFTSLNPTSSILESIYVASCGRSFRTSNLEALIKNGSNSFKIRAYDDNTGSILEVNKTKSKAINIKINNSLVTISELARTFPSFSIDSKTFFYNDNAPDYRRKHLDRGLFIASPDYAKDWFDMDRLEETPYMMYAVDVIPEKQDKIPSIVHIDGTCRIQTVSEEQNRNYYELINEFYSITDVPIVFNTSFNLAGDTIVETIDDAFNTLRNSEIEYLYLPEIKKLIYVPNK